MKAWVLHDIGDFRYEDREKPELADDEVLVHVKAAGICGSDVPRIYQTGAHNMPLVPGHEFSGVVEAVGSKASEISIGKRVGIFPLIPCGTCPMCETEHYEMCSHYDYLGSRRDGGFSEYVAVPKRCLVPLPDSVSFEQGAMIEPTAVAAHAMRRVSFEKNENIVILGLGTIGMLLLYVLLDAGYENVYVIGNKDKQKERVLAAGLSLDRFCDSRTEEEESWIREKTGSGADVVFECVGRNETVSKAVELTAPMARVVFVGNPASDMTLERNTYWQILRRQLIITGTWNSSFAVTNGDDWSYIIERMGSGVFHPEQLITQRLKFDELEKGLLIMRDKTEDYCKVMIAGD
ncbi:MAG: galactitol-1-phosphate 5-dehydrogenase [Lachnospiraceae bacterium]|nr:galactitol-1-phosphate 5-dehydrogenase [Lachnospiraceae bacterium]